MERAIKIGKLNDAIKGLEFVQTYLPKVLDDPHFWKWVIVALHNSLQGFMVCALKGGSGLAALKKEIVQEWLKAYRSGSKKYPAEKLDDFLPLYKKIKSDDMIFYVDSKKFCPRAQQGRRVKQLNKFRNKFIHFVPAIWYIEVEVFFPIVRDCLDIIEFLAFESGNIKFTDASTPKTIKDLILKAKKEIEKIREAYGISQKDMNKI